MKKAAFIRNSPHLPVKDLRNTLDYYRDVLGFSGEWTWPNNQGESKDGGIRRDEMRLLFAEEPEFVSSINNEHHRLSLMWFVEEIEKVYDEFKKKNIALASELQEYTHGLNEFAFIDINGYYIRVAETARNE